MGGRAKLTEQPQGVVGILTGPDGYVWSSVTDFDRSGYGGYTQQEAQELRVKQALSYDFVRKTCSDVVLSVIQPYRCDEIVWALINQKGFKRTLVPVGYDDAGREALRDGG